MKKFLLTSISIFGFASVAHAYTGHYWAKVNQCKQENKAVCVIEQIIYGPDCDHEDRPGIHNDLQQFFYLMRRKTVAFRPQMKDAKTL